MANKDITSLSRRTQYINDGESRQDPSKISSVNDGVGTYKSAQSIYNTFNDPAKTNKDIHDDGIFNSNLWHGVPRLTPDQMRMFEAAYTGHSFFFVTSLPAFMTTGRYKDATTNVHMHALNLKTLIEKCCRDFSNNLGVQPQISQQDDGDGRVISYISGITQGTNSFQMTIHEFAGLPLKNGLETWLQGISDINSQHGHYYGNLGIKDGWCLKNHSMSILAVQVDPSWTEIQEAVHYVNVVPSQDIDFSWFNFTKGDSQIIPDATISFSANAIRNNLVNQAAIKYMNNKILTMVDTAVYNTAKADAGIPGIKYGANGEIEYTDSESAKFSVIGPETGRDTF